MENYKLQNDIKLFCIKANSFPDGITTAHNKLVSITKADGKHNYYGISYLYDDKILYLAGTQIEGKDEQIPPDCETFTLKKGNYISVFISDFAKDISLIEKAFNKLTDDPRIDPNGCCAECYFPEGCDLSTAKDVRCMVRLAD